MTQWCTSKACISLAACKLSSTQTLRLLSLTLPRLPLLLFGGESWSLFSCIFVSCLCHHFFLVACISLCLLNLIPSLAPVSGISALLSSPEFWYSLKVLKGLRVTDIPFLKSWIHSLIMTIFQSCQYLRARSSCVYTWISLACTLGFLFSCRCLCKAI